MIALLVVALSAYTLGQAFLALAKARCVSAIENLVFAVGLGLGIWCCILFVFGLAGILYRPLLVCSAVAPALFAPFLFVGYLRRHPENSPEPEPLSVASKVLLAGTGIILLITFIGSFAPVVGGVANDEICTHLSVPKEWLLAHRMATLPFVTSYLAGNAHLLFLLASCFESQAGPHLISWLCFVLCLGAVYRLANEFLSRNAAVLAVAIAAMNPLVFRVADIAYVDLQSSLFALLPLCALANFARDKRRLWLAACGFYMGIGCGIKPTNIVYSLAAFALAAVWLSRARKRSKTVALDLLTLSAVALVFAAPWPARNLMLTGSPVFPPPLAQYRLGEVKPLANVPAPYSYRDVRSYYDYCLSRYADYRRSLLSMVRLPWDITMNSGRFQIGDSMGTIMLSLLPLAFFFAPLPWAAGVLLAFAALSGVALYFGVLPEARYYIAAYLALCPVAAFAAKRRATGRSSPFLSVRRLR